MSSFLNNIRLQSLLLFALSFLLYANTLGHGFVMDDRTVITENKWTQQGLSGISNIISEESFSGYLADKDVANLLTGGRYRPLSLVFFATLVQFFGNNSIVFHLFAVVLYSLCCLLLYRFLLLALKTWPAQAGATTIALVTTVLFAVHPVHTEVVANIKSCDEQMAFLAGMGALFSLLRAHDSRKLGWNIAAGALFLLACLAKENAATLLAIAPLMLWVFRGAGPKSALRQTWPFLAASAVYVLARGAALDWQLGGQMMHDPLNNPFLKSGGQQWVPFAANEKAATIAYTLLEYARLLVWPWPLTHDYYPFHISVQTFAQPAVWVSLILHLLLFGFAFWGLRRKKLAAFGLLFYAAALSAAANVFVPVGTFMAERFLFMPSAGFCLVVAALAVPVMQRNKLWRYIMISAIAALAVTWGATTVLRNPVWVNEERLLKADLAVSPNSAKLRNSLGTTLLVKASNTTDLFARQESLQEAETHLRKAVELHPTHFDALLAYGACVFYLQKHDLSVAAYRGAAQLNPQDAKAKLGLTYALRYGGDYFAQAGRDPVKAVNYLNEAWQLNPDTATATHLAELHRLQGQPLEASLWLEQALSLSPGDPRLLEALSKARAVKPNQSAQKVQEPSSFLPTTGGN